MLISVTIPRHVRLLLAGPTYCPLICSATSDLSSFQPETKDSMSSQIAGIILRNKHDCSLTSSMALFQDVTTFSSHAVFCASELDACAILQRCRLQTTTLAGNLAIVHASFPSVEYITDLCPTSCWRVANLSGTKALEALCQPCTIEGLQV